MFKYAIAVDKWEKGEYAEALGWMSFGPLSFLLTKGISKIPKVSNGKWNAGKASGAAGKINKIDIDSLLKGWKSNPNRPGNHLFPEGFDPLGGMTSKEFLNKHWDPDAVQWDGKLGGWDYPKDSGFDKSPGVPPPTTVKDLKPGTKFDRFGGESGDFVAPEGTPFPDRALPPDSIVKDYHRYELTKEFDKHSGFPTKGTTAKAFEQPGGGTQYKLPKDVEWLLKKGYLKEIFN